jgi:putative nucleotidyltransferase with HDIG domain
MGVQSTAGSIKRLPGVLATTMLVFGLPILVVYLLRESGSITEFVPLLLTVTVLSLLVSTAGAALWAVRGHGDAVFGDMLLWGWGKRWWQERQLDSAVAILGLHGEQVSRSQQGLTMKQRARLLEQLTMALEARDPGTHRHSQRVARHSVAIAKRMGLSREEVVRIRTAAAIHDVGKIETPLWILCKREPLTEREFATIKRHSTVGAGMAVGLGDGELVRIVRHHHERLDGKGYPDGLAGDQIPLGARIIAVADTFDAVTSARPYREARKHSEALELLSAEAGTQLDPDAVHAFRSYYSGLRPATLWALLLNGPRQLLFSLSSELKLGALGVIAKAAAATTLTVAGAAGLHSVSSGNSGAPVSSGQAAAVSQPASLADSSPGPSGKPGGGHGHQPSGGIGGGAPGASPGAGGDGGSPQPKGVSPQTEGASAAPAGGGETTGSESSPGGEGGSSSGEEGSSSSQGSGGNGEAKGKGKSVTLPTVSTPPVHGPPKVTEPVNSAVGEVLETVESAAPEVKVPVPPVVEEVVSKLPNSHGHGHE